MQRCFLPHKAPSLSCSTDSLPSNAHSMYTAVSFCLSSLLILLSFLLSFPTLFSFFFSSFPVFIILPWSSFPYMAYPVSSLNFILIGFFFTSLMIFLSSNQNFRSASSSPRSSVDEQFLPVSLNSVQLSVPSSNTGH